jgi:hypothetical protein
MSIGIFRVYPGCVLKMLLRGPEVGKPEVHVAQGVVYLLVVGVERERRLKLYERRLYVSAG